MLKLIYHAFQFMPPANKMADLYDAAVQVTLTFLGTYIHLQLDYNNAFNTY